MAEYKVTVTMGPDQDVDTQEAYSPIEAAFLTGVALGAGVVRKSLTRVPELLFLPVRDVQDMVIESTRDELSSVLVEEKRYAR
jgi:hypothetical protein